ncbi:cytoskeleton-associated protein 5 [Sarotherodon galilaeus]
MEYITLAIRWCCKPEAHINVCSPEDSGITKWSLTRWEAEPYQRPKQHLTIVCMKINTLSAATIKTKLLRRATNLWVRPSCAVMTQGSFDTILNAYVDTSNTLSHTYVILTTPCSGSSFYEHVNGINSLATVKRWKKDAKTTACDADTIFQLHCEHVPHSLTVVTESQLGGTKLLHIRCDEPQLIRDLLKRHDIHCDTVWNEITSLSSNAPCIGLMEHSMNLIYTMNNPGMLTGGPTSRSNDTFDHNRKYLKVHTKRHTMKNKPYSIPMKSHNVPRYRCLDDDDVQGDSAPTLPTVLYYSDPVSTVNDVLRADGRFLDDCQVSMLFDGGDDADILGEKPICQFQHNQLCIVARSRFQRGVRRVREHQFVITAELPLGTLTLASDATES